MSYRYAVLGGGRQGTAAAYDLALRGDAAAIAVCDRDAEVAAASCRRLEELLGGAAAEPVVLDVTDPDRLRRFLERFDSCLSAVPYRFNLGITRAAIDARTHLCDLGGNTALVERQLALDREARAAGVSVTPDCGQVPGMGTTLMVRAMSRLDEPVDVKLWDGGLPQEPRPPWNYLLTFHVAGLTNEYDGNALFLRDGELAEVPCFDPAGYERIDFGQPFGELEAFVTAGGTSTAAKTFAGKLRSLENRTLRYPGHAAQWTAFRDAGLLGLEPVEVGGASVVPRDLLHALLAPRLEGAAGERDVVLIRVVARGRHGGREAEARVDLFDRYDEATGFTAMQRTTGWDLAIVAAMMAAGDTGPGAVPRETSIDPARYVGELERRGFELRETVRDR